MFNWLFRKRERIVVKIAGEGDLEFLHISLSSFIPNAEVRQQGLWKKTFFRDEKGQAEVFVPWDQYMREARIILKTLGFTIVEENYGSVPKNALPPLPAEITYTVRHNGRTVEFDLSVRESTPRE